MRTYTVLVDGCENPWTSTSLEDTARYAVSQAKTAKGVIIETESPGQSHYNVELENVVYTGDNDTDGGLYVGCGSMYSIFKWSCDQKMTIKVVEQLKNNLVDEAF